MTTDLSAYSLAAVEYVASFTMLYASRISLLHVVEHRSTPTEDDALRELQEFAATHIGPPVRPFPVIRSGHAPEEIARFAREAGADLIVMATHGRTGLSHIVMGSVAEKTVRLSSVPVLTVKPRPLRDIVLHDEDVERELHLR